MLLKGGKGEKVKGEGRIRRREGGRRVREDEGKEGRVGEREVGRMKGEKEEEEEACVFTKAYLP